MHRGLQAERWNHTASIMSLLANINSDPKRGKKYSLRSFHPFLEPEKPQEATPEILAQLFGIDPSQLTPVEPGGVMPGGGA
jgi:hypothetical protein